MKLTSQQTGSVKGERLPYSWVNVQENDTARSLLLLRRRPQVQQAAVPLVLALLLLLLLQGSGAPPQCFLLEQLLLQGIKSCEYDKKGVGAYTRGIPSGCLR